MAEVGEECGVFGIYLKNSRKGNLIVPQLAIHGLSMLQHRGQRSAGISVYNPNLPYEQGKITRNKVLITYKDVGAVSEVFRLNHWPEYKKIIERCKGIAAIGHTRYSTAGYRDDYFSAIDETQPFERRHPRGFKRFAIGFNGNIVNSADLAANMEKRGYILETEVDTEVLMNLFSLTIKKHSEKQGIGSEPLKPDFFDVAKDIMGQIDGSYNIISLFGDGDMLVFRDPKGFHPLCWGENEEYYAIASESAALEKIKINNFKDVRPGESLIFNSSGVRVKRLIEHRKSFCHFELVYFAKANSFMEGVSVKEVRRSLGNELAKYEPLKSRIDESFIVVPAPKTAIPAAESYAAILGLEIRQAIEKNEEIRGFINPKEDRVRIMDGVYIFHPDLKDKRVIVVDDSIVRGETSEKLIKGIRKKGALEVHLRLTEPPIKNPCFYGIDYPTKKELIASCLSIECSNQQELEKKIALEIGADSVKFQTLDGLIRATALSREELCLACLTGEYPTPCGQKHANAFE